MSYGWGNGVCKANGREEMKKKKCMSVIMTRTCKGLSITDSLANSCVAEDAGICKSSVEVQMHSMWAMDIPCC